MIGLLSGGDHDVLRDATTVGTVFWHRASRQPKTLAVLALLTVLMVMLLVGLVLGPAVTGINFESFAIALTGIGAVWGTYGAWVLFKLLPGRNDRVVIGMRNWVRSAVDPLEEQVKALSDDALRARRVALRQKLAEGAGPEDIRGEAYALVREASRRARAHRQFECQLIGGRVIEGSNVAEMRTGEGKTIVCYMANYMKVLQGLRVHMVTVNDYLVKRDAEFCRPIFELLGVSVGYITSDMESYGPGVEIRRQAYACDITYGTNSEFGFDYLRDNMKHNVRDQVQGRQDFVVVDEVDSVLIDEARTPLIISGPAHDDVSNYRTADNVARKLIQLQEDAIRVTRGRLDEIERDAPADLKREAKFRSGLKKFRADPFWITSDEAEMIGHKQFFVVEMDRKSAHMTEHGAKAAQAELGIGTFYDSRNMNWPHYIDNAIRSHIVYQRDKEYVVQDGTVIIVDEFTGRLMHGRQWSDGLHQSVEAKERVQIKQETQTLATITLQNLFKMYKQLAGMTGTAMTESDEFMKIYRLEVTAIPTNKPIRRIDYNDKIYRSIKSKFDATVREIEAYSREGYAADPFSLEAELREARKQMSEMIRHGEAPDNRDFRGYIERISAAIKAFNDGQGDHEQLVEAYRAILGDAVGENRGGRPVLVGTVSVESSEKLSQALSRVGIEHEVLNAKNHAREAEIVAKAGQQHEVQRGRNKYMQGNVTIATNMAGRGTDIVLGPGVAAIGGLHVVGTERHESRRIDNQLRGRCGRQGDPGSSRFFLSLEDDLIRLFMGEFALKLLSSKLVGFEEGMAIEMRTVSRGIEKAQRKVEERNFGIRKNLLEYDEVMDHQRRTFYEMRQRVLEGRDLSELVWEMIDQVVNDTTRRYYDPDFAAGVVVEWVAQHLGAMVPPDRLDTKDYEHLCNQVRDQAASEARSTIQQTFGEYIDTNADPEEWDTRGLVSWAAQFGVTLTQRQARDNDPEKTLDLLMDAATKRIENADLAPLQPLVDPQYGRERLVNWAHEKFGLSLQVEDLPATADDAEAAITERMREAYRQREVDYPVSAALDFAAQRAGSNVNAFYDQIVKWANLKFGLNWSVEAVADKDPQQLFVELRAVNEQFLRNGRMDAEIDAALAKHNGPELTEWARQRFGAVLDAYPVEPGPEAREALKRCAYEMCRYELTQLERMVMISTLDGVWKDHMYSMDLLRNSIGLRGYAERDPKIEYKREGTRLFNEMLANVRDRVTDLIFKVRLSAGPGPEATAAAPQRMPVNVTESRADMAAASAIAEASRDQQAAMRPQGEAAKPKTIRRDEPKVGRNDPCPCGSGKKYKQCHGKAG